MVVIEKAGPRRAIAVVGDCRYDAVFDGRIRRWRVQTAAGERCSSSAKLHSIGKLFGTRRAEVEGRRAVEPLVVVVVTDPAVLRQVRRMRDSMETFPFDSYWVEHDHRYGGQTGHTHRVAGDPIFHTIGEVAGTFSTRADTLEALEAVLQQRAARLPPRMATTLPGAIAAVAGALATAQYEVCAYDGSHVRIVGPWLPPDWDVLPPLRDRHGHMCPLPLHSHSMPIHTQVFESQSGGAPHTAQYDDVSGESSCSCPGWRNKRPTKPRGCRHTALMAASRARGVVVVDEPLPAPAPIVGVPDFIRPMLAHADRELPLSHYAHAGWTCEEKFNGQRVIVCVGDGAAMTWSRPRAGSAPLPKKVAPHNKAVLAQLPPGVYDGEEYVPGGKGFWASTRLDRAAEKVIVLWDILQSHGQSTCPLPLTDRRQLLGQAIEHVRQRGALNQEQWVSQATPLPVSQQTAEAVWALGGEGLVLKDPTSRYCPGKRSHSWLKVKKYFSEALTITGYDAGETGPHAVVLLRHDDGGETRVKNQSERVRRTPASFIGTRLWIEHQGRTESGSFLHPMHDHLEDE